MAAVLVTGARGFVGEVLARRLAVSGVEVRALLRESTTGGPWTVSVGCRLGSDPIPVGVFSAVATVFHAAGVAHAFGSGGNQSIYRAVNVDGTRQLVTAAGQAGVRRFVFFSSVKAGGDSGEECTDEAACGEPEDDYGRSKREAEEIVFEAGRRFGMRTCVLRPALVYGPGVKGNLHRMLELIDRGWFPPLPKVENRRSMVHVEDLVEAALLAAGDGCPDGRTYIVSDDDPVSTRQVYEWMCEALGRRVPGWVVSASLLRAAGAAGEAAGRALGRPMPLNREVVGRLLGSACYRSDRIRRELGWRPRRTFRDALPEMVEAYRAEVSGRR